LTITPSSAVHDEAGVGVALLRLVVRRRGAPLGDLGDPGDELGQLFEELLHLGEALFGLALVGAGGAGRAQVLHLAFEAAPGRDEVVGEEDVEGVVGPAMDGGEGDEALLGRGEGEVDGAVFVELLDVHPAAVIKVRLGYPAEDSPALRSHAPGPDRGR
jgi:hypothetical protein